MKKVFHQVKKIMCISLWLFKNRESLGKKQNPETFVSGFVWCAVLHLSVKTKSLNVLINFFELLNKFLVGRSKIAETTTFNAAFFFVDFLSLASWAFCIHGIFCLRQI